MTVLLAALSVALSAGNAEFDRFAAEGAAKIAADRFRKALVESGPAAGVLEREMSKAPAKFKSRAAAEEACRKIWSAEAEAEFAAECAALRKKLLLPESFPLALSDADRAAIAGKFPAAFDAERRRAVAAQAKGIVAAVRPTEAEFEEMSEAELVKTMTDRIARGGRDVFDENVAYISNGIVRPMVEGGKAERKRQRDYLMRARSEAAAPSRLAADIESALRRNVADRAKDAKAEAAWGVFPSVVSEGIPEAVERRTLERLASMADGVKIDVTAEQVLAEVVKAPEAHAKAKDSERIFSGAYSAMVLASALDRAVEAAPQAERGELKAYLSSRLTAPAPAKAVERVVRRDVMPKWKEARAEAARIMAGRTWPTLADGTWYPDAELADATAARSDYAAAVKGWRKAKGMEALAAAAGGRPIVEEADRLADARVSAAFDRARSAIAAQNGIVDASHAPVLAEARARKESMWRRTPDLGAIVKMLTQAVESRWASERAGVLWPDGNLPSNADAQHKGLFPSVRRRIELLARTILDEMEKTTEADSEDSRESDEEQVMEFTISVRKDGGCVAVKLLEGKKPVVERNAEATMESFSPAMKEVSDRLGRDLLHLR